MLRVDVWEMEMKNKVNVCINSCLPFLRIPEKSFFEGQRIMSILKQGRSITGSKHEILISLRELSEFMLRECLSQGHSFVCKYEG